jgi:diguanylate cyclase (GGDEF)-like protein
LRAMSVLRSTSPEPGTGQTLRPLAAGPSGSVPTRALALSAAALAIPLLSQWYEPELATDQLGILLWLPVLVPAFLLTYYRGWRGASLALAAGMAVLTAGQVLAAARDSSEPDWRLPLVLVALLVGVSLGIGWVGELLHRARREAAATALIDRETGMPNRRHLTVFLDAAFGAAERGGRTALVLFQLDDFAGLARANGRSACDAVVRVFAATMSRQTRRVDLSVRFGDAQFISVLTGADALEALGFVDRVRSAFAQEPFPWGVVTVSAGVAYHTRGLASPDALIAEADRMLHQANGVGPGEVVLWEPGSRIRELVAVPGLEGDEDDGAEEPLGVLTEGREDTRGRVLVVEDVFETLGPMARLANRLGFEVDGVIDAGAALDRLAERPADIVIASLVMPDMAGFTLADRIARDFPGIPVLLVSPYEHDALAHERRPASLVGFLRKPVEVRDLGVMLERALAEARAGARRHRRVEPTRAR